MQSEKTLVEIASHFGIHPNQVPHWIKRLLDEIERLWRIVKYEEVYLKDYGSVQECREGLAA